MAVILGRLPKFLQDGKTIIIFGQPSPDSLKQSATDEGPKSKAKPKKKNAKPRKHK